MFLLFLFFFQAEDGIRDGHVTGVQTCALPICMDPFTATLIATLAGACAGVVTGWLNVSLRIMDLLASILVMIALYSINLRIMGRPNVPQIMEPTVFTVLQPQGQIGRAHV